MLSLLGSANPATSGCLTRRCCSSWPPTFPCLELVFDPNWLLAFIPAYVTPSFAISDPHPGTRRASVWRRAFPPSAANPRSLSRPYSIRTAFRPSPCAPSPIGSQRQLRTALPTSHLARQPPIRITIRNSKAKSPSWEQQQPRWETRATTSTRRWLDRNPAPSGPFDRSHKC